jgi:ribosomal protein L11 methyltransferase
MIDLFPDGFEERESGDDVELVAYTDGAGEEQLWATFGTAAASDVESGWEDNWRTFHRPVSIGRLWVGPPWATPEPRLLAVAIDPGRAFGTGAHGTTRLCLELLQELEPGSLLDVGCGSGVLGIAGARLGFAPVIGIDEDPAAVAATLANAAANGVDVDARLADARAAGPLPATDVAVVNISTAAIAAVSPHLRSRVVVTSGYLLPEAPALAGYRRRERRELDGWAADVHERA